MTAAWPALRDVVRVGVGSTNPPKIAGVRAALGAYAPRASVEGVDVESGVSDQPLGFDEIVRGARTRARAAARAEPFELSVGYEDGLVELPACDAAAGDAADATARARGWFNVGCAVVQLGGGRGAATGLGFSSGFAYPPACVERAVRERAPIGGLFDALWRERGPEPDAGDAAPSSLGLGNVGKLTGGVLDRAEYTRHAVVCALASLLHPDLYAREDSS